MKALILSLLGVSYTTLPLTPLFATQPGTELFPLGNAESEGVKSTKGEMPKRTALDASEGSHAFLLTKRGTLLLEPMIAVEREASYHLSVKMRSVNKRNRASANFGVYMYDANKRLISIRSVGVQEKTQTQLLHPLEIGSREAWLESAGAWLEPARYHVMAFGAKEDHSDLPNFALSSPIETMEKTEQGWKVTFKEPVAAAYPAGTTVRQHRAWKPGLYWVADGWVPDEWTTYSTTFRGEAPFGTPKDQFWKGTRYVRLMVRMGTWDRVPKDGAQLLVDEISFRRVPLVGAPE